MADHEDTQPAGGRTTVLRLLATESSWVHPAAGEHGAMLRALSDQGMVQLQSFAASDGEISYRPKLTAAGAFEALLAANEPEE